MRLLIVTQKVDERDAVLGFMHGWIDAFSKQVESVSVVCLEKGRVHLPEKVSVFSLGKERLKIKDLRFKFGERFVYAWRFVRYIIQKRNEYDAVLVHMNSEYIVLGGWFWKLWGKTVTLWYAHKSVTWSVRLAHPFTDIIFTSTKSGFRLPSNKVRVIGQGIDTEKFNIQYSKFNIQGEAFRIVTVGRISPSKDYETLIDAIEKVCKEVSVSIKVDIIGPTSVVSDEAYLKRLNERVEKKGLLDVVTFKGPVANSDLPEVLSGYDLFVNMGHTGSLDKAVPEAMAVGIPVLTCNEAFRDVLGPFTGDLMYPKGDFSALSDRVQSMVRLGESGRRTLGEQLRAIVVRDHSLEAFVRKVVSTIESPTHHD
ncbi:MAG: glycosyltransferase family 4 protein [Candidatus Taylorbacteria bacterium]|nr:glycosyltransferase family 4 protein [Candidatus Taylorbacteria bacterium]